VIICEIHAARRSIRRAFFGDEVQEGSLKIRLTKTVRDLSGSLFPKGSILEARIGFEGAIEVVGAQHTPLNSQRRSRLRFYLAG
jgi:hypothetical protein